MRNNSAKIRQGLITEGILGGCICGCLLAILILLLSLGGSRLDMDGLFRWIRIAFLGSLLAGGVSTISSWGRIRQKIRILELRYGRRFDGEPLRMLAESQTVYVNADWLVYHSGRDYRVYARPEVAAVDPLRSGKRNAACAVLRLNGSRKDAVITYAISADEDFLAAAREWCSAPAPAAGSVPPAAGEQTDAPSAGETAEEAPAPQPLHMPSMQPRPETVHHRVHPLVWIMLAVVLALILVSASVYSYGQTHVQQDYPASTQSPLGGISRRV